jgi:N4-gp56 family major capsid protein
MTVSTFASANKVAQWSKDFHIEWNRDNQFARYTSTKPTSPIQLKEELTKAAGETVTVSLVTRLTGSGVTGDNTLEGNEEAIGNYGHQITVNQVRNAIAVGKMEQQKGIIDLLDAARPLLKSWRMNMRRTDIIRALQSPNINGKTAYASTAEGDKDIWVAANTDRVLFGAAKANYVANDHSASLLNIDGTNDILQPAIVALAHRMAKTASPHIHPIRTANGEEFYILFANSLAFRDLANHATMTAANRDAMARGKENPVFAGGDLYWQGVLIHEVPEIDVIAGVGAGAINVAPNFLIGAQAVGIGIAEETHAIMDDRDYGNIRGRGVADIEGVEKLMYNSVQHGVVTIYTAGVADT